MARHAMDEAPRCSLQIRWNSSRMLWLASPRQDWFTPRSRRPRQRDGGRLSGREIIRVGQAGIAA